MNLNEYLLISPLLESDPDGSLARRWAAETNSVVSLQNRVDTRENRLRQLRIAIVAGDESWYPRVDGNPLDISFGPAELLHNGDATLVVAWVHVQSECAVDSLDLELALSRSMEEFVTAKINPRSRVRWVSRTLLRSAEEPEPQDWMVGQKHDIRVMLATDPTADSAPVQNSVVTVGWANNSVSNFACYSPQDKDILVAGLVDAQVIWTEAEVLSHDSLNELNSHAERLGFKVSPSSGKAESRNLLMSLSLHNVTYDELLLSIQGYRREIAKSSLDMWRYPELIARISRQITEVNRVESERLADQRTKYESLVGNVLLIVGLISVAQLILAVIQTAFGGSASEVPGEGNPGGLMSYFRATSIDAWIWGSMISVVIVFAALTLLRKRIR